MAFQYQLSQEKALRHFADQRLGENKSVMFGQSLRPDASSGKDKEDIQRLLMESAGKPPGRHHQPPNVGGFVGGPTWLNSSILQQESQYGDRNFLNLHTNSDSAASNQWLPSRSILQRNVGDIRDDIQVSGDSIIAAAMSHDSANLKTNNNDNRTP